MIANHQPDLPIRQASLASGRLNGRPSPLADARPLQLADASIATARDAEENCDDEDRGQRGDQDNDGCAAALLPLGGAAGTAEAAGASGVTGAGGAAGTTGAAGTAGSVGASGAAGTTGASGALGSAGGVEVAGAAGAAGAAEAAGAAGGGMGTGWLLGGLALAGVAALASSGGGSSSSLPTGQQGAGADPAGAGNGVGNGVANGVGNGVGNGENGGGSGGAGNGAGGANVGGSGGAGSSANAAPVSADSTHEIAAAQVGIRAFIPYSDGDGDALKSITITDITMALPANTADHRYGVHDGRSYELVDHGAPLDWADAVAAARARGGDLAVLDTPAEMAAVTALFYGDFSSTYGNGGVAEGTNSDATYIGLSQQPRAGSDVGDHWTWNARPSAPVNPMPGNSPLWFGGEPNDESGGEDNQENIAALIDGVAGSTALIVDHPAGGSSRYLIEYDSPLKLADGTPVSVGDTLSVTDLTGATWNGQALDGGSFSYTIEAQAGVQQSASYTVNLLLDDGS